MSSYQATVSALNYRMIIMLTSPLGDALAAAALIDLHLLVTGDRFKNTYLLQLSSYRSCRSSVG